VELRNTIGAVTPQYIVAGGYRINCPGAFPVQGKVALFITCNFDPSNGGGTIQWSSADNINIGSFNELGTSQDGILTDVTIEIRVYP